MKFNMVVVYHDLGKPTCACTLVLDTGGGGGGVNQYGTLLTMQVHG